jgi:hypothetical protein
MMNLVPLSLATRHVYLCVQGYAPNAHLHDRFNGLGYLLASLGGLYVVDGPDAAPRELSREELAGGFFRQGAASFHFHDERPAITDVRVTRECIEKAIAALRKPERKAVSRAL